MTIWKTKCGYAQNPSEKYSETTTVCFSQEIVRYIENGDNTVTDTATGLIWQQADDGNLYYRIDGHRRG